MLDCATLSTLDLTAVPDAPSRVLSAAPVTLGGIAYCDVKGYIAPQTQFDLKLPVATWRGQYVQVGCGGYCGAVPTADANIAPQLSSGCAPVNNGELAIASDNEGHVGSNRFDGLWGKDDPQLRAVFGYSSEHSLAQVSKAVIARYYGQPAAHSFFDGCSDGGREALMEAQRYPADFDGILAGAPALDATDFSGILETWIHRSNTDGTGRQILGTSKLPALHAAVLKACAGPDGLIDDPRTCGFEPASLQCPAGTDSASCLTPAEAGVARAFYSGPADQRGRNLYPGGLPYGSELAWAGWNINPAGDASATNAAQLALNYLKYLDYTKSPADSSTLRDFRFTDESYARLQQGAKLYNATNPDLTAFSRHGGKIILYHGWADQAIPPFGTAAYYRALADTTKDYTAFSRLYMIPGQYHCLAGGNPQATGDLLTPLMSWVQGGQAPGAETFPTFKPTAGQPAALTVQPYNPYLTVGGHGYNNGYRWIGHFH
ncbi:tannase/feruloyl esterase family alpha/beta hydrolase [Streptomyces sp. H10-C2]|uniref:tannase/feruloyl esterase family alpha/beta hydrolase n=1 Tax=unclassified Streptomyces TaxID=2593676 RepID=UPI0024BA44A4|nr:MULTISPECIES: tannase/feruloyl esterase family alpha/beta hydrolase [unclassified Streptomyces]MDJ0340354.1 tannase/feruloyl esterase family alpha/beta hydrolase [Streptomyces sp. PH10-H1]MDJ0368198.1 tannase/feruloyl esterase family alpha/beta hydrolase [Streptomyces sp. H10-C2]